MNKHKLKILIASPYDMYRFGGVQQQILMHAKRLRELGNDVKIIAPTTLENLDDDRKDHNIIELGRAAKAKISKTHFEVAISAEPEEISSLFAQNKFDVLHVHEPLLPMLMRQLVSKFDGPIVATFHGRQPETIRGKSIEMMATQYSKGFVDKITSFVAPSTPATAILSQVTNKPIRIIPNAIDLNEWNQSKVDYFSKFNDGLPTILFVGRLEKRKGCQELIKAYSQARKTIGDNLRLVVAGDGPERRSIESYIELNNIKNVYLLGFVSEEEKKSLIKTCTMFAAPALYGESFGIVLLEAMSLGAPILAGNNEGYSSVMSESTGYNSLVDPESTAEMSRKIVSIIESPELRQVMKTWGEGHVKQFSCNTVVDQYLEVYNNAMESYENQ